MSATTAIAKPRFFSRPIGMVVIIGAIVVLWSLMANSLSVLIILALIALLVAGIKKPLWALVALILSQLSVTGYMVNTPFVAISLRLLLFIVAFIIIGKTFLQRKADLGPGARRIMLPMLVFFAITIVTNMINIGFGLAFKDFRAMLIGVLFVIFIPAFVKDTKELKTLCVATGILITASAVIGIMQHYNILGMAGATTIQGWLTTEDLRVPGMSESELELSYILSAAFIIVFCLFFTRGAINNKRLLPMAIILILAALYFTYTRSALLALGFGLLSLFLFLKIGIRWEIILVAIFIAVFFVVQTDILEKNFLGARSSNSQLESTIARSILWQAGIGIVKDNPVLGIGADQFIIVSPNYASAVDQSLIQWETNRYFNWSTLGSYEPHNDFLNVWVSYGSIALIIYFWFHFAIIRHCFLSFRRSKDKFVKALSLGLAGALVTWVVNSFFHNITSTLPLLWIIAGFSLAAMKMAAKNDEIKKLQPATENTG